MSYYGVIDLGSNTVRLVIYQLKKLSLHASNPGFKRLVNSKDMAGLAAFVDSEGVFTPQGITRAENVLSEHLRHASYFDCERVDIFATAVIRNAANRDAVVEELENRLNKPICVLSGEEEAHLDFVGATCDRTIEEGLLIDIGGASTELISIQGGTDIRRASIPQGSLSSFADYVSGILPTKEEMKAISHEFTHHLLSLPKSAITFPQVYGIGGSIRAATKMHAVLKQSAQKVTSLAPSDIEAILHACAKNPDTYGHYALKAAADRVHTLTPGCCIIDVIMKAYEAQKLTLCKYGVREGYLIERMLREK